MPLSPTLYQPPTTCQSPVVLPGTYRERVVERGGRCAKHALARRASPSCCCLTCCLAPAFTAYLYLTVRSVPYLAPGTSACPFLPASAAAALPLPLLPLRPGLFFLPPLLPALGASASSCTPTTQDLNTRLQQQTWHQVQTYLSVLSRVLLLLGGIRILRDRRHRGLGLAGDCLGLSLGGRRLGLVLLGLSCHRLVGQHHLLLGRHRIFPGVLDGGGRPLLGLSRQRCNSLLSHRGDHHHRHRPRIRFLLFRDDGLDLLTQSRES